MKILAIQGSPRKNGNTDILLDRVLDTLREKTSAEVEKLYAADLDVAGCAECFACQKVLDKVGCAIQDDMTALYDKMLAADLILFASPVFCWGLTAQLKAVFDRLYATFKFSQDPYVSLLRDKRTALIVTAGGGKDEGADICEECYKKLFEFAGGDDCGALIAPSLKGPTETKADEKLLAQAVTFAKDLAKRLV